MPGLNQLKQFSNDVENLGNERAIRSERGEPLNQVPLPEGIAADDDSGEFVHGLSDAAGTDEAAAPAADTVPDTDAPRAPDIEMSDDEVDNLIKELGIGGDDGNAPDIDSFLNDPDISDLSPAPAAAGAPETPVQYAEPADAAAPETPPAAAPDAAEAVPEGAFADSAEEAPGAVSLGDFDAADAGTGTAADTEPFDLAGMDAALDSLDMPDFDMPAAAQDAGEAAGVSAAPDVPELADDAFDGAETSGGESEMDMSMPEFDGDAAADIQPLDEAEASLAPADGAGSPGSQDAGPLDFESSDVYEIPDELVPEGVHKEADNVSNVEEFDADDALASLDIGSEDEQLDDGGFDIPGFSDVSASSGKDVPLASERANRQRFELTDSEYEKFKKNLATYPLNLRIALEDMVVKNEFKDAAVYEVLQKVVKRVSARQLAGHLEKMLGITIDIPRDFERRTAAQYAEYKNSFEYKLKNKIIPFALLGVCACFVFFLLFLFAKNVVYIPLRAELLYKEGYALLEEELYPQAELRFSEAVSFKPKKRWFFEYARGYRERRQYDRARTTYERLLAYFDHDLKAGLEYAGMEANELANYEEAVNILKRDVLDYHINDKDGLLMLGDVYLEWATEQDPSKFEDARSTYASLMQLYGNTDLYLSRMLRYFIRIDDLSNVLALKNYFYPKKKALGGEDLIELSGYLLDKLYGTLSLAEEYLRSSIEDVRSLLERAVEAAPDVPESIYNLARYFMYTDNRTAARSALETALQVFQAQEEMRAPRMLRYINTYRYLGELYAFDKEYIRAQELYTQGIDLYEHAARTDGLQPSKDIGMLYADMGDIYYFESGDMAQALRNYTLAVQSSYDTPPLRYRIGYIAYTGGNYDQALSSFIAASEEQPQDANVLLAMGNTLAEKGDNFTALGYYRRLLSLLNRERARHDILFPQVREDQYAIVDMYCKAANNSGVVLYRLARQTGQSSYIAEAQVNLSESVRAYDALTRNMDTFVRMDGSNLAAENSKYMSQLMPQFDPEIYTDIPMTLADENMPE